MSDTKLDLQIDLTELPADAWHAKHDSLGEEHGYYERLGPQETALFIDAGPRLLVTFETRDEIAKLPGALPRGFDMVTRHGWSLLALISDDDGWFRAPQVWRYFDRLIDEGFLEDFDRVMFFGHHAGGHAAASYSVAAPGARVLVLRPVATLDPAIASWDRRYMAQRRLDFSSRYGYAPDMVEAARRAFVIHDPLQATDAVHASLFARPNVTRLRCPHAGARVEKLFDMMQITAPLIEAVMDDRLDTRGFAKLWRARRDNLPYLRSLLKRLEAGNRDLLAARLCRFGLGSADAPFFARKLEELRARGVRLPGADAEAAAGTVPRAG